MKLKLFIFLVVVGAVALVARPVFELPNAALSNDVEEHPVGDDAAAPARSPQQEALLHAAFSALGDEDYARVRQTMMRFDEGSVERKAILWAYAHSGAMSQTELRSARKVLAGWPGDNALAALEESNQSSGFLGFRQFAGDLAGRSSDAFTTAVSGARDYLNEGDEDAARERLLHMWIDEGLSAREEQLVLTEFGEQLTEEDHARRYFNMMSRDRIRSGSRLAEAANMQPLHDVWTALIRGQHDALSMLENVPDTHRLTTAFKFIEVEALRQNGLYRQAAEALENASTDLALTINPDAWWVERRIVSRSLREAGRLSEAYQVASAHRGGSAGMRIESSFHAGWYALQLRLPARAASHFQDILDIAQTPISRARGAYWLGRALRDQGKKEEANQAFADAAQHATTFYGLLAATKLGEQTEASSMAEPPEAEELAKTFVAVLEIGKAQKDPGLLRDFSISLMNDEQAHQHATEPSIWLSANGFAFEGLRLAKAAQRSGHFSKDALYPTGIIPDHGVQGLENLALAHAIARQESEFRLNARSPADALGLMQLLPSTAEAEAKQLGLAYKTALLTTEASYNAKLGLSYISRQLERFDGSYVLALIAYNAGPGRAAEWKQRFGTPVGLNLEETIDWIEQIPFPETRNYVFRVLENYAVYRNKYGLDGSLEDILVRGYPSF